MNTKKTVVLGIVLVVAVGLILIVKGAQDRAPSAASLQFFKGISPQSIGSMVIKNSLDWVKLKRKGDVWVMIPKQVLQSASSADKQTSGLSKAMGSDADANGGAKVPAGLAAAEFPVDSNMISQLLENIVKLKKKKEWEISESPAKQAVFEVDSAHGNDIEVFDLNGKSLGEAIIGTNGPDYNSVYCRAASSNMVYQCLEVSSIAFGNGSDHKRWTDKTVMKFDKATVKQIAIAKRDTSAKGGNKVVTIVVARGDSAHKGWQLLEPVKKPADSTKVDELLSALSNLQATEYEDSACADAVTGLANPLIKISVAFASGTVRSLSIGNAKPTQSKSWIRVPEKPFIYLLNDYEVKKFDKKPDSLFQQPLKPIEAVPAKLPAGKMRRAPVAKK
jgi:hypothetical protein